MKNSIAKILIFLLFGGVLLAGCAGNTAGSEKNGYIQISQDEAWELMNSDADFVILDVRTEEEYNGSHIPRAIYIPVETIGDTKPELLPEADKTILVYCRSGRRSKQAAEKLVALGYSDVREFGGINSWKYDIEKIELL